MTPPVKMASYDDEAWKDEKMTDIIARLTKYWDLQMDLHHFHYDAQNYTAKQCCWRLCQKLSAVNNLEWSEQIYGP